MKDEVPLKKYKQKGLLQQRTRSRSGGKTAWYILTEATENKVEIRWRVAWYISKEATENKARNSWYNTWKIKDHQGSSSDSRIYWNSKGLVFLRFLLNAKKEISA